MALSDIDISLIPDAVHVWQVEASMFADKAKEWLSPEEQERAGQLRQLPDRERYITGRAALRYLSGQYLQCNGKLLQVATHDHGKPYWQDYHRQLTFNHSHSGEWVVLAFTAGQAVGIDIQKRRDNHDMLAIARKMFHSDEVQVLEEAQEEDRLALFHTIWTRKEAVVKAIGSGIYSGTNRFSVLPLEQEGWQSVQQDGWHEQADKIVVQSFSVDDDHIGALAVVGGNRTKIIHRDASALAF